MTTVGSNRGGTRVWLPVPFPQQPSYHREHGDGYNSKADANAQSYLRSLSRSWSYGR
jgi:hypothetical protein